MVFPYNNRFKNKVANGCGYSTLTSTYQKHTACGDLYFMKKIEINSKTYGTKYVLVDDEDYDLVNKYKWNLDKMDGDKFYAIHSVNKGRDETGKFRYTSFKIHRLIMNFPKSHIDHKDNDGLNNQRSNLRLATSQQNSANSTVSKRNKTGFKGVTYRKDVDRYACRVRVNGDCLCYGHYKTPEEAAKKYNEVALLHFGEFAKINIL
jgi:hypothetical protein